MKSVLEIACFNLESALIAEEAGADRIELCEDFLAGGITPSPILLKNVMNRISLPVFVMIRPRSGNFVYSENEFQNMKDDILSFKKSGVHGFVFGIINDDNEIDKERNELLVNMASPLPCTFHRAFDMVADSFESIDILISCGFKRILTSGLKKNALEGMNNLKEMVKYSKGKIIILPGGSVRSQNIALLKERTLASEFHSSGIVKNDIADLNEIRSMNAIIK
jgi:copper homeostasis protein